MRRAIKDLTAEALILLLTGISIVMEAAFIGRR